MPNILKEEDLDPTIDEQLMIKPYKNQTKK